MGSTPGLFVDPTAIRAAATTFDTTAGSVAELAGLRLGFGAAGAGRAHGADGALLRDALDAVIGDLRAWSRAAAEVSAELRSSADRYVESERVTAAGTV